MDTFLWWSGVVLWAFLGVGGILSMGDTVIDWTVKSLWTKREFLDFVWEKMKAKRDASDAVS